MTDPDFIRQLYDRYPELVTKGDVDAIVDLYMEKCRARLTVSVPVVLEDAVPVVLQNPVQARVQHPGRVVLVDPELSSRPQKNVDKIRILC